MVSFFNLGRHRSRPEFFVVIGMKDQQNKWWLSKERKDELERTLLEYEKQKKWELDWMSEHQQEFLKEAEEK